MTKILILPPQLRQTAEQLRSHEQKIDQALHAIDNDIRSLKGHQFLGRRADAVQTHYAPKRDALLNAKEMVLRFSSELETTAKVFETADKTGNMATTSPVQPIPVPAPTPTPLPKGLPSNWKDIEKASKAEKGITPELIAAVLEYEKEHRGFEDTIEDIEAKLILWYEGKLEDFEISAFNKYLATKGQSLDTISFGPAQMNPEVVKDLVNNGYIPKPENWDTDQTDVILKMLLDKQQAPALVSARLEQIYDHWQDGGVDLSDRPDVLGNLYGIGLEGNQGIHADLNENQGPRGEDIEKIVVRLENTTKVM